MCAKFGENVCRALTGFHAFSGCDSVSALSGKGKSKAFGVLNRSVEFSEGLSRLGENFKEVGEELSKTLERAVFLCQIKTDIVSLYVQTTHGGTTKDNGRSTIYKSTGKDPPVVSSAWTQAYNLYQRTKGSHELLESPLNMAEAGVKTVVDTSVVFGKPLVERYQPQIVEKANSYACEKLNQLEEKYPVINKPTEEKVKIGITTLTSYIPESVQITLKDRIDQAKQYSDELIKSFQNVNSYEEVPSWLLAQAQDKMGYVQETVNFLTEYLLSKPLDWLIPKGKRPEEKED
ncbi:ADRP [Mytilus edulis]|uniref:PLIN2 n=1 Tax=Mytilus edulis TaxID=6550 RepID=A0A8S3RE23_MYTED|nr:ADRP [Mytilus edulis]